MIRHPHSTRPLEQWISLSILLVLAVVAVGVFRKQYSFNPAVLIGKSSSTTSASVSATHSSPAWVPSELKELGAPESFTPENLYDKIDGKAELYVSAGVRAMNCQRFALKESSDDWLEWFVYDMGKGSQAFSVFSTQRRAEAQPMDFAEYAYQTRNALFFVAGSNYVEVIGSSASAPLMRAATAMAERFVAANAEKSTQLDEMQWLPKENQVPGSSTLQAADAFGFDQFKNVFTARYKIAGAEATAFVISCPDAIAAATLRDAYRTFLISNGGKESAASGAINETGSPIEIMGTVEMVFSHGRVVAGVHSAATGAIAEQLAKDLLQSVSAKIK